MHDVVQSASHTATPLCMEHGGEGSAATRRLAQLNLNFGRIHIVTGKARLKVSLGRIAVPGIAQDTPVRYGYLLFW